MVGIERYLKKDPREDKLPAWAKEKLREARYAARTQHERAETARLATNPHESDVVMAPFDDTPIGLGTHNPIRFYPNKASGNDWEHIDVRVVHTDWGDHYVEVMAGRHSLTVSPVAANVVRLRLKDD